MPRQRLLLDAKWKFHLGNEWGTGEDLAKLYGGLNHPDKALALLERLETEYGQTLAARRARQRLAKHGLMTGGSAPE